MLVNRRSHNLKMGSMLEAVSLLKAEKERINHPHPSRIYLPKFGPFHVVTIEIEFESLEEYDKFWSEWFSSPEGIEFNEKFMEMTERGGTNEIWVLEE